MIPNFIVVDGVNTTLANAVSTTSTNITLASSANLPTLGSGQMMPLILQSASNASANEVVYVTAISGASLTVLRGQEGTSAQSFAVGDLAFCGPTAGTVPLLGIQTLQPTASTSITPSYMTTIVQPNITEAATITIEPGTVVGQRVRVYGGADAVTVQTNVTAGSPALYYPDGSSTYAWTIPVNGFLQYIDMVWDGDNWRCTTSGQTVVAPATQSNAAVQLAQVLAVTPQYNQHYLTPASGDTYTISNTFTAPCNGFILAVSTINVNNSQPVACINDISINDTSYGTDSTLSSMTNWGVVAVSFGTACAVTSTYKVGTSTDAFVAVSQTVMSIFIPNP